MPTHASVVGTSPPAESLKRACISLLPRVEHPHWTSYLRLSETERKAEKDAFYAELKRTEIIATATSLSVTQ